MREPPTLSPLLMTWLMLLGSCASPPRPPTVDESRRRPVNSVVAVDLQACRNDLQNARIAAAESGRRAESAETTLHQFVLRQQTLADAKTRASSPRPNSVFTVRFGFGSTQVSIPDEMSAALIDEARRAPLIVLRGRTDGVVETVVEGRIARERAAAVFDYLVGAGIAATHIRSTYQPVGDHAADNDAAAGRAINRRVEIEVYRTAPVEVGSATAAPAAPHAAAF